MSASPVVSPAVPQPANRIELSLLVIILLVALGLRVWAIDFGLPYLYHPDEPSKIEIAQHIVKTGDLNPHYFKKPTLLIYANALLYLPYYAVGKAKGEFTTIADIPPPERLNMGVGHIGAPGAVVMGRTLTALVGVLGVLLTWVVGRRLFGRPEPALLRRACHGRVARQRDPESFHRGQRIPGNGGAGSRPGMRCESMTTARAGTISWRDFLPGSP